MKEAWEKASRKIEHTQGLQNPMPQIIYLIATFSSSPRVPILTLLGTLNPPIFDQI